MLNLAKIGVDCVTMRDFTQYYPRSSYFGWPVDGEVLPCLLQGVDGNTIVVGPVSRNGEVTESISISWKEMQTRGYFGVPIVGNTPVYDTYIYLAKNAVRESQKGLRMASLMGVWFDRDHCARYAINKGFNLGRGSREIVLHFPLEMGYVDRKIVYDIYNPAYLGFSECLRLLRSGEKLGIPMSLNVGFYFKRGSPDIQISFRDVAEVGIVTDRDAVIITNSRYDMLLPYIEALIRRNP